MQAPERADGAEPKSSVQRFLGAMSSMYEQTVQKIKDVGPAHDLHTSREVHVLLYICSGMVLFNYCGWLARTAVVTCFLVGALLLAASYAASKFAAGSGYFSKPDETAAGNRSVLPQRGMRISVVPWRGVLIKRLSLSDKGCDYLSQFLVGALPLRVAQLQVGRAELRLKWSVNWQRPWETDWCPQVTECIMHPCKLCNWLYALIAIAHCSYVRMRL
jgi:hypothetical protein